MPLPGPPPDATPPAHPTTQDPDSSTGGAAAGPASATTCHQRRPMGVTRAPFQDAAAWSMAWATSSISLLSLMVWNTGRPRAFT